MTQSGAALDLPADLRARVGQLILIGFRGLTAKEAAATVGAVGRGSIGGVLLFDVEGSSGQRRNILNPAQTRTLVTALQAAAPLPLFVALDGEGGGGEYNRLDPASGFPRLRTARELGETDDLQATYDEGQLVARTLADIGVNLNLAPVVDLIFPANRTIAALSRSFSSEPAKVAAHARAYIQAHRDVGVATCLKHFPGSGSTTLDRASLVEVAASWSPAELEPFRALVAEGMADAILASRALNRSLDPDLPPMLSKRVVGGLLRAELGFDGVVVSDAMEMTTIWDVFGFDRAVTLALNAGVDLLLFCNRTMGIPYDDGRAERAIDAVVGAVERGEIAEETIDAACRRVLRLKAQFARSG